MQKPGVEKMNNKNHKSVILKTFSIFTIFFLLIASSPVWTANAQDTPTETPTEEPVAAPTEEPTVTPTEEPVVTPTPEDPYEQETPTQETVVPAPTETEIPGDLGSENIPPTIRIIHPSEDITVTHGDTIVIQWEDEDPDDNALIQFGLILKGYGIEDEKIFWISDFIPEDLDGIYDEFSFTTDFDLAEYRLVYTIDDKVNPIQVSLSDWVIEIIGNPRPQEESDSIFEAGVMKVEARYEGEYSSLYLINQNTKQEKKITSISCNNLILPMFERFISISPNSLYGTFVTADSLLMENAIIWLIDLQTLEVANLGNFATDFWIAPLTWSPDSSSFVFVRSSSSQNLELWLMNIDQHDSNYLFSDPAINTDLFIQNNYDVVFWKNKDVISFIENISREDISFVYEIFHNTGEFSIYQIPKDDKQDDLSSLASLPCSMTPFSQNDPAWKNIIMKTCNYTIGAAGCALTSAAMEFKYYGVSTNPSTLNSCLGNSACPISWSAAASSCSSGKVTWVGSTAFSWTTISSDLSSGKPVILSMDRAPDDTHFVVIISGSGSTASGYTIIDSWDGLTKSLTSYGSWNFNGLRRFSGQPSCQTPPPPPPPPNEVYVNKPSLTPAYSTTCGSYWYPFTGYNGNTAYLTENAYTSSQSSNSGTWTPNLPSTGKYKVEAYIANHGVVNVACSWGTASYGADTSNARYQIYKTSSSTPVTVIKDQLPYSNQWITLGEFDFNAGTGGFVKLSDLTGETYTSKNVSFSAMRFTLVSTNNPVPTISSISPTVKYVGDGSFTLTVNGTNFVSGSVVRWNGSNRTTTYSSSTKLTASISASDIASAGTATVTVYNPTPGGGTSNSKTLAINYPVPAITSISPTSKIIGEGSFTLTVNGSGFVSGSVVRLNGSNRTTTFVSSTKLTAAVTAADIANVGTASITVYNPTPGGGSSNAASLSINYPVPIISSISPTVKETGDSGFTLTVNGSNFISGSVIRWNGSNRTTTFVSSSKLTASISSADIASVGTVNVTVYTPTPGGGTSNNANLQINYPVPQISSIIPNTISTGESGFVLTIYGSKFVNGSVVKWNGSNRTTTYINASQLTASIPASDIANSGVSDVTVFNPTPGGGTSGSVAFTVVTRRPSQNEILLTTQPTFICPSVANATMYNLQVSTSMSFGSYLINQTFTDPNYSLKTDLPRGQQLFWRTRAQVNGIWGEWSDTWSFISANSPTTPSLISPASNALVTDLKPKLDWSNSSLPVGAIFDHYHLEVAEDSQFSTLLIDENIIGLSNSEFFPPENLSSNMKYYWRVRAFNTDGQFSAWSTVGSFRESILPPALLGPSEDSLPDNLRPGFEWQDVDGASSYTIQVSLYSNMKEPKVNTSVADSQFNPTKDLPVKSTLYWRVRANGANGPSLWSEVWSFNTPNPPGKPSLLSPADNALIRDYTPRLDWSTSTLPSGTSFNYYRLQIAWDKSFNDLLLDTQVSPISNSEYTLPDELQANTPYYWRVMAVNDAGQYRSWSTVRSFRTAILPPLLITPEFASVESTQRPLFDWEDVDGATSYQIQISRYTSVKDPIINVTVPSSEYLIMKNLPMNKDIYWRVRAKGANGPSAWSPIFSFIINFN
jgi:hypothetical protein